MHFAALQVDPFSFNLGSGYIAIYLLYTVSILTTRLSHTIAIWSGKNTPNEECNFAFYSKRVQPTYILVSSGQQMTYIYVYCMSISSLLNTFIVLHVITIVKPTYRLKLRVLLYRIY